jgi:conjugative transposon TraN protein
VEVNRDGDILGVVTIVTERYRSQYGLVYTSRPEEAVTDKTILLDERTLYDNPAVSLSTEDMARYARKIWLTSSRYSRKSKKHKVQMQLNNIYAVGEYFFIDFSVYNKTNIRFDIDQLRIKLQDKKKAKATTVQTIELEPAFMLDRSQSFLHGYRNVIVIRKLTFPDDKILTIELSEKQISGRTISLTVKYSDVLNADAFSRNLK